MNLLVCLDDNNGMLFNGRRQSMDASVRQRMLFLCNDSVLYMNHYSATQFERHDSIRVVNGLKDVKDTNGFYFLENEDVTQFSELIGCIYIFRWNRVYPADVYFPFFEICSHKLPGLISYFPGNSHECITEEVYFCDRCR